MLNRDGASENDVEKNKKVFHTLDAKGDLYCEQELCDRNELN